MMSLTKLTGVSPARAPGIKEIPSKNTSPHFKEGEERSLLGGLSNDPNIDFRSGRKAGEEAVLI